MFLDKKLRFRTTGAPSNLKAPQIVDTPAKTNRWLLLD
jgi:hypothetical protein